MKNYGNQDRQSVHRAPATTRQQRAFAVALLLAGAVCAGMGQTIVFSVLPPIARDLGLSDFQVGFIFMLSAICWVACSPRWGRFSDNRGRKPFILIGLLGFTISTVLFAASIQAGLLGWFSGLTLYALLLGTRLIYGVFGSASPPAAQAYIADRTDAADRTAGIAGFSAAFGLGAMLGPGIGAVTAAISPTAPFFAVAAFAAIMCIVVAVYLPERTRPSSRRLQPKLKLRDPRIRVFVIYGVTAGILMAIPTQTVAFYFIDHLGFSTELAPQLVGVGLMAGAMASLFAQLVVVQRFHVAPSYLLRGAPALICAGHILMWSTSDLGPVIFGMVLAGFGAGLAVPGYNAAASLAVSPDEQGAAIGLTGAAGAAGFIISPPLGFSLYAFAPQAPYILTSIVALILFLGAVRSNAVKGAIPKLNQNPSADAANEPASRPYR
ncbi:MAG: MFS transporter [Pseudomonadota bacterium]